jgi:hypothetical protein
MPYHPLRLRQPLLNRTPVEARWSAAAAHPRSPGWTWAGMSNDEAAATVAEWAAAARRAGGPGAVVVLDARPERLLSLRYRQWLAAHDGAYVAAPSDDLALATLAGAFAAPYGPLGWDRGRTRTVLSFGVPLLEGRIGPRCTAGVAPPEIVQIEARCSATAQRADRWVPIRPGTEAALALGLAHVIVHERRHDPEGLAQLAADGAFLSLIDDCGPQRAAALTGVPVGDLVELARRVSAGTPAVALAGADPGGGPLGRDEQHAIAALALLIGSFGREGGFVERRPLPVPAGFEAAAGLPAQTLADLAPGSVHLLLVDAATSGHALPRALVRRLLAPEARLVCLSPYLAGLGMDADLVIPAPAPLESFEELTSQADAPAASYALAAPILPAPADVLEPAAFVARLLRSSGSLAAASSNQDLLRRRVDALFAGGRGTLFDPSSRTTTPLAAAGSADAVWEALVGGGCWTDEAMPQRAAPPFAGRGRDVQARERLAQVGDSRQRREPAPGAAFPLALVPFGRNGAAGAAALPPSLAKIHRESDLEPAPGALLVHPQTAAECGLADGRPARLATPVGSTTARVCIDPAVMPGVVHVAIGPDPACFGDGVPRRAPADILAVCAVDRDATWRVTPARLEEV